ncbi:MAG: NFACT RNA binding domain-containing protein [Candidatus Micrarchaeota archaeon]
MEISLDVRKSARAHLQEAFEGLKKLKEKRAGLLSALEQTKKEMAVVEEKKKKEGTSPSSARSSSSKKKGGKARAAWHSPYHSFVTSGGRRVVAGRDAKQNDELVAKYLAEGDLFFHADIQGAPTVILKDGQRADGQERKEAAQFAASHSSAWKVGASAVDVYAVKPSQVSKHAMGGYVGRGAFAIEGEREWYRQTPLALRIGLDGEELRVLPACHPKRMDKETRLGTGGTPKEEAARTLSSKLSRKADEIAPMLPSGKYGTA